MEVAGQIVWRDEGRGGGGGGGDSRQTHQTRPHTPGEDEVGDGGLVKRSTAGAKEIRAGLYLTFPTCGLHLGGCVRSIPSLTVRVSQRGSRQVIDLLTASTTDGFLKESSQDFTKLLTCYRKKCISPSTTDFRLHVATLHICSSKW